jgi:hypothetical protein
MFASSLWRPFVCIAAGLLLGACAYATAIPVDYNSNKDGFRVYDMKPILIVNNNLFSVEFIPNYNKAYAVQFGAFLAKQKLILKIEKGFITNIDSDQDATAVVALIQDLVKTQLPQGGGMSGVTQEGGIKDRFQVYDFVFDDFGNLIALRPLIRRDEMVFAPVAPTLTPKKDSN